MKMRIEYECWKCSEWHQTDLGGSFSDLRYGWSAQRITLFGLTIFVPNFVGDYQFRKAKREMDKNWRRCDECGKFVLKDKALISDHNEVWCAKCM
jgi:hypothetical protein